MKRSACSLCRCILLLFFIVFASSGLSQTVIDAKGTRIKIDTSKWYSADANIFNKSGGSVGIGTKGVANSNAILEIKASNKGMLIPRLALTGTSNPHPLTAHIAGMVVYNTSNTGDVAPGIYYADGSKWVRAGSSSSADTTNDHWKNDVGQLKLAYTSNGSPRNAGAEFVITDNGNVGIGTPASSAKLHTKGFLRFEHLPSSASTTKLLGISDIGNVSTREAADFYPTVLAGADGADALTTTVTASTSSSGNAEPQLAVRTFTLTRKSVVQIRYNIAVSDIKQENGTGNVIDGTSKKIGLKIGIYTGSGSTAVLSGGEEVDGFPYTNADTPYISGYFYLNQTIYRTLQPGSYELRIKASVNSQGSGVSAKYGANTADRIDIIAIPVL